MTQNSARLALLGRLATIRVFEPDFEGALDAARPLLASGDDALISRGAYVSSIALALLGRCEEAVSVAAVGQRSHVRASGVSQLPQAQLIGAVFGQAGAGRFVFENLGASLLAAEAYLAAAAIYRGNGLARPATAMTRRAAELAAACGAVRTPVLALSGQAERLTRRELEVAGMAAAGASNREIAARLVLSVRTVDNHLQNAYNKLGVTSRDELAKILSS